MSSGAKTVVMDADQLRWLLLMCRTGEGLDDTPKQQRQTERPPADEMRHSIISSLPPLRLEGIEEDPQK